LVVVAGLLAVLTSSLYLLSGNQEVLKVMFVLYSIFSGGIAGVFLLGFFFPRADTEGLTVAIIFCSLFTAYAILTSTTIGDDTNQRLILDLGSLNFSQNKLMLGVYTHLIILGVGWGSSCFFSRKEVSKSLLYTGWLEAKKEGKV